MLLCIGTMESPLQYATFLLQASLALETRRLLKGPTAGIHAKNAIGIRIAI